MPTSAAAVSTSHSSRAVLEQRVRPFGRRRARRPPRRLRRRRPAEPSRGWRHVRRALAGGDTSSTRPPAGTISASQMAPAGTSSATPARAGCRAIVTSRSPPSAAASASEAGSESPRRRGAGPPPGSRGPARERGRGRPLRPRARGRATRRPNPLSLPVWPCSARRSEAGCARAPGRIRRVRPPALRRATTPCSGGWRKRRRAHAAHRRAARSTSGELYLGGAGAPKAPLVVNL